MVCVAIVFSCVEQPYQNVRTLAEQYVAEGKVSSMKALIAELSDGEGHKSIHFAVSRNHLDTTTWFLDEDPESVRSLPPLSCRFR